MSPLISVRQLRLALALCILTMPAACSRKSSPESPTPTVTPTPVLSLELPRPTRKSAPKSASVGSSTAAADQVKVKAETGDAAAECDLGRRYERGDGVPKDYPEAVKWLRKAADQGYAEAQYQLGNAYCYGHVVETDYDQAFAWYGKAAGQGNIEAEAHMGVCYALGYGVQKDDNLAAGWYRKSAGLNNALAQNNLGTACMQGRGVTKDVVQGYKWILLAAAQREPGAKENVTKFASKLTSSQLAQATALADAFRAGDLSGPTTPLLPTPSLPGGPAESSSLGSSTAAADQVKAKAEAGDAAAECDLGMRYARGDGVPKDYPEAVKWLRKAAEQDYADGQRQLGNAYFYGKGVEKDYDQAFAWYSKAAGQGNIEAQASLGVCYEFGYGVRKDDCQAAGWYRKASELNNALAQNNLGSSCILGRCGTKDVVQGYKWILLAAAQGYPLAQKNVTTFESKLTAPQLVQARALADAFRAGDLSGPTTLPPLPTPSRSIADNGTPKPSRYNSDPKNRLGLAPLPTLPPAPAPVRVSLRDRAEAGDAAAQCQLGLSYLRGVNGVPKSPSEGVKWLTKAAEQNNALAELGLGNCYLSGEGVRKNYSEAYKWFYKAAQQNDSQNAGWAQANLGYCYMTGFGVRRDDVQAYKWFALGAAKGDSSAQTNLAILQSRMSRSAIAQGQGLVREFAPGEGAAPEGGSQGVPAEGGGAQSQNGALKPHDTGTGFFVTDDGYLITNFHVVKDGAAVELVMSHSKVSARVVKVDATNDLALLKADGVFVALPVGSSVGVKLGDTVSTIGFPFPDLQGVTPKFTRGEISSLAGARDDVRFFQISTQIQPGNSGGALVDERGNVVGVTSSQLNSSYVLKNKGSIPENVNYAIKSSLVLSFLRSALDTPDKLKSPTTDENKPADVIDRMQQAAALVVVYWHTEK
jgi:TPR repeat protein